MSYFKVIVEAALAVWFLGTSINSAHAGPSYQAYNDLEGGKQIEEDICYKNVD